MTQFRHGAVGRSRPGTAVATAATGSEDVPAEEAERRVQEWLASQAG